MNRRVIILLSLCCGVMCAFVGYVSYQVTQESEKSVAEATPMLCYDLMESPPIETHPVLLKEFFRGKHLATIDTDGDRQWDLIGVPLFPTMKQRTPHSYRAVILLMQSVPDESALAKLLESGEFEANYWPERQTLEKAIHSQLAQHYVNMDLVKSPVLHYGFPPENPLLGETSLMASMALGALSVLVAFGALISGLFKAPKPNFDLEDEREESTNNRAGLPETTSFLDQVTSLRDQSPVS